MSAPPPPRRAVRWAALVAVPWLVLAAGSASAQTKGAAAPAGAAAKTAAKPADKRAAQKLLAQGNQLVGEGDYLGALEKFKARLAGLAADSNALDAAIRSAQGQYDFTRPPCWRAWSRAA